LPEQTKINDNFSDVSITTSINTTSEIELGMQSNAQPLTFREKLAEHKVKIVGLGVTALGLVSSVSAAAFDINGTVGPILDGVALLFIPILNLIMAYVPVVIVLAIITFVLGILSGILASFKIHL
jgi:hypothetical protein